ncbi:MAG: GldG family protein [Candidatus Cloacimonetes bacterium]|nr:GldG family protein [Candidatus Cloacimonadota bacterium]
MKKNGKQTHSILSALLIKLAIIVMILLVASFLKLRLDFSNNKAYSLGTVSKQAVRSLKDNMVVKIFASEELPPEMSNLDRYLKDLLSEYQIASKGKFHYEYIRGLGMEELRAQAEENGLSTMYFRIYENDKTTNKEVIFGIVFEYQGKFDSMNLLPQMEPKLEYELTLKVQKLAKYTLPEICVFRDSLFTQMSATVFNEALQSNFNVIATDLFTPPKQTEAMIFAGVMDSLSTTQLYNLDQYIMQGGNLVVMQDRVATDGSSLFEIQSNIFPFLSNYGVDIDKNVAMDIFCDIRGVGVDTSIPFPIYPILRGSDHPITRNISDIIMYLATGISFTKAAGLKFLPILESSASSGMLMGPDYQMDPSLFRNPDPELFNRPPITLGAIVEGKVTSFFTDKEKFQVPGFVAKNDNFRMVVFGDRELSIDSDKNIYADRNYIILNAVDWLLKRDSMLAIRSRHLQQSILDIPYYMNKHDYVWGDPVKLEKRIKTGIKLVSTVLPSLLLIGIGGFMALRRKQIQGLNNEKE